MVPIKTLLMMLTLSVVSGCYVSASSHTRISDTVPRSDKAFQNNPDHFQFVVVGDRTGGHRPGVFSRALDKINALQPEFVVSVGDLIEGYSDDEGLIRQQWQALKSRSASVNSRWRLPFIWVKSKALGAASRITQPLPL